MEPFYELSKPRREIVALSAREVDVDQRNSVRAQSVLASDMGRLRCEPHDLRAVGSNIDHPRKQIEPHTIRRPGGLVARLAACELLARSIVATPPIGAPALRRRPRSGRPDQIARRSLAQDRAR